MCSHLPLRWDRTTDSLSHNGHLSLPLERILMRVGYTESSRITQVFLRNNQK